MESRSRASPEQFLSLLEFMESHGDIARPQQGAQGRVRSDQLWHELEALLNSSGGGVYKSVEKWKKVWADWKAKTKKKALVMRREASGTGGGPSSRLTLTAAEQRVLGIMGLNAVVGQAGIEERGFDEPPTQINQPSQVSAADDTVLDFTPARSIEVQPHFESSWPPTSQPAVFVSVPPATSPIPSTSRGVTQRSASPVPTVSRAAPQRRLREATPSPVASPSTVTPRRQRLFRARTRRVQTPFERATSEFVTVENRRLQLEVDREANHHQREMEKLRLESLRLKMEEQQNQVLNRLTRVLCDLTEILSQLKSSSLPSTDPLSLNP